MFFSIQHIKLDNIVYVNSCSSDISDKITCFFEKFKVDIYSDFIQHDKPQVDIKFGENKNFFEVIYEQNKIETTDNSVAFGYAIHYILDLLAIDNNNFTLFHGSSVKYNEKCICFLGNTKVGKSSIISKILYELDNSIYMTDDVIGIDQSNNVCSFPKPIFARNMEYLKKIINIEKYEISSFIYENERRDWYLAPNYLPTDEICTLDKFIILKRSEEFEFTIKKLRGGEVFSSLWENFLNSNDIIKKRQIALNLSKKIDVYEIYFSEIERNISSILEIFS